MTKWEKELFETDFTIEDGNIDYLKLKKFIKEVIKVRDRQWVNRVLNAIDYTQGSPGDHFEAVCSAKKLTELLACINDPQKSTLKDTTK